MSRPRKGPWKRKSDGCWYTTRKGGNTPVKIADADVSPDEAHDLYCEFHGDTGSEVEQPTPFLTVSFLIDEYLGWCKDNRSARTFEWYNDYLVKFHTFHGPKLRVAQLKPFHVTRWVNRDYKGQSESHRLNAIRSIFRVMNWAVKQGYIRLNPIAGIEKPAPSPRETYLTEEQFKQIRKEASDDAFRDFLDFTWETGCRPQEIRVLTAKHFDGEKFVLERKNSKGKRHNRIIYLNDKAKKLVNRLIRKHPKGAVFRNSHGAPWSRNAVICRFRRLKDKVGIPELCCTILRHSWATNALRNGLDTTTVSLLMGHLDPTTVQRNYQHLAQDHKYMQEAAMRSRAGSGIA